MSFLRAVVLDNDETTGSYGIVFAVLSVLQKQQGLSSNEILLVLNRLAKWMLEKEFFRPGLGPFIETLVELRENGSLDAILMYTNQVDCTPFDARRQSNEFVHELYSPAHAIAYMISYLVQDYVFEYILTRPLGTQQIPNTGYFPKQFKRIFDLFPEKLVNTKHILFFDDLATPEILRDDGIAKVAIHSMSRVMVPPYRRQITEADIHDCINTCFKGFSFGNSAFLELRRVVRPWMKPHLEEVQIGCSFMRDIVKIHFEKHYNPKHR
jgi:hypothetical protein